MVIIDLYYTDIACENSMILEALNKELILYTFDMHPEEEDFKTQVLTLTIARSIENTPGITNICKISGIFNITNTFTTKRMEDGVEFKGFHGEFETKDEELFKQILFEQHDTNEEVILESVDNKIIPESRTYITVFESNLGKNIKINDLSLSIDSFSIESINNQDFLNLKIQLNNDYKLDKIRIEQ